ncbi:MAG: AmmeMemoRadiSam system protein B [SAR324 cluster bacterium]|nr:AmmeMemoRadiSam system protein B [SAR324 cluster bacterium]
MKSTRKSAVDGLFYPNDPAVLQKSISSFLKASQKEATSPVKFIIAPHAGYSYSGKVAGAVYTEIASERFNHVILLGPSHRHYFQGVAESVADEWETPLGPIEISHLNHQNIVKSELYHSKEHCLEVQFPFIKYLNPSARVSPLLLSGERSHAATIAQQLLHFDSEETLWIISSDFNHTGPSFHYIPEKVGYRSGKIMDQEAIRLITAGDIDKFSNFLEETHSTICGALPILVAMYLNQFMSRQNFVFKTYDCSGNQTGDVNSVGYAALYC